MLQMENMSSAESQKGVNAVQHCSIQNHKGTNHNAIELYSNNALLVLKGIVLTPLCLSTDAKYVYAFQSSIKIACTYGSPG